MNSFYLSVSFLSTLLLLSSISYGFQLSPSSLSHRRTRSSSASTISMEYIPDGLTKAQWADLKKREEEELKKKAMGALGTTKFKSRSFEAWQKAGAKHLFPVNPNEASYEERPYMQRKDGDWEGKDLKKLGLQGKGQGEARERLKIDNVYDDAYKQGKLASVSIFGGANLPWTNQQAAQIKTPNTFNPEGKQGVRGVAGKKLSPEELERLKAKLVKPVVKATAAASAKAETATPPAEKKGGFFGGLFK